MKAFVNPPMLTCAHCGSVMLIQRPRDGYAPVRCLNKDCEHFDVVYGYELVQLNLKPWTDERRRNEGTPPPLGDRRGAKVPQEPYK